MGVKSVFSARHRRASKTLFGGGNAMSDIKEDYMSILYALNQIRKHLDEIEKVVDGFYFLFNEHSIDFKKIYK